MVGEIFQKVLDMSLIGCYSILIVMTVRMLLSKCERKYTYYLWFVVFFNLCIPFSFRSIFSLIPDSVAEFSLSEAVEGALEGGQQEGTDHFIIPQISDGMQSPAGGYYIPAKGQTENMGYLTQVSKEQQNIVFYDICCTIWLAGIAVILVWSLMGTFRLRKWIARANWVCFDQKKGIAEVTGLGTPFLWGFIRPTIYLPAGMEEEEMRYVVAHEQYHRKRRDYLVKIAVFFVAAIHWFNPLVWAAYALFCKDMEISCDEAVLQRFDGNIKKQYAGSLLKYAARQSGFILTPITFGEPAVKSRIKNVLYFKKRGMVISVLAVICVVSVAAGLVLRPSAEEAAPENRHDSSQVPENQDDSEADIPTTTPSQPIQGEETNDANDDNEVNEDGWYGSYVVTDYVTVGITAMSQDDMMRWLGYQVMYGRESFDSDGTVLEKPDYSKTLITREEFESDYKGLGGGYTFELLGVQGDSLLSVTVGDSDEFGGYFYVCDGNRILIYRDGVFFIAERGQRPDIVLTDQNKELLQIMCVYLPEFSGNLMEADEDFWKSFIFRAFTGTPMDENGNYVPIYGEGEYVQVYRENLGFMDGEFKISERYVREYARLILGVEMPEIRPTYEDIRDGQTALYYEDGYYYIPVSDFGEEQYRFRDLEVIREPRRTYAYVYYDMLMFDSRGVQVAVGTVTFELCYEDNINGFVITGKNVERR